MRYRLDNERRYMEYLTLSKSSEIVEIIYSLLYKAEALATLVIQADGEIRDFEKIAPIIINSPVIRNILFAPDGIVTHVYPMSSNEYVLGYNLLGRGEGNQEAILAQKSKRLTLGGPFNAIQGGQVLVGRLPVFMNQQDKNHFWGLVSVTLSYPDVLSKVHLQDLDNQGYACNIWRISPDSGEKQIILSTNEQRLIDPIEKDFSILNAVWKISIAPTEEWYNSLFFRIYIFSSIFISILISFVVQNYFEMRRIKVSLEHMAKYDSLTGLPNRRFAFEAMAEYIEECTAQETSFVLSYADMNKFKEINDRYGHHVGDLVLKEVTRRIALSLPKKAFVARIGGDEFIILLKGLHCAAAFLPYIQAIHTTMEQPFYYCKGKPLQLSISIGVAAFPTDGTTIEELTTKADHEMYHHKGYIDPTHAQFRGFRENSRPPLNYMCHPMYDPTKEDV